MKLSDLIVIYNYKEPLTKVKGGHGYYGCVSGSQDKQKIQCHICGKLFHSLNFHLKVHDIGSKEYKESIETL